MYFQEYYRTVSWIKGIMLNEVDEIEFSESGEPIQNESDNDNSGVFVAPADKANGSGNANDATVPFPLDLRRK